MAPKTSRALKLSIASKHDQISSLPDDILCHILSFLPTKESLCTRVLSTRWKYLFASVPILDFEYDDSGICETSRINSFIDFVNSIWILYGVSRMHTFRLWLWVNSEQPPLNHCTIASWIFGAIRRKVQQIDFTIMDSSMTMTLPRDIFLCKTLTFLSIKGDFNISLPNSVCAPCLRTCYFGHVCFCDDSAKRLFNSLPALETLEFDDCYVKEDVEVLNICAPNLIRLTIHDCVFECQIELNVPNLIYFEYIEWTQVISLRGLESLKSVVDATIDYRPDDGLGYDVMELLHAICHVRKLTLSSELIEAFLYFGRSFPTFNNLTHLMLGPISSTASKLLPELLYKSPRLEYFSFNQWQPSEKHDGAHQNNYSLPEHVPTCVLRHLREVECRFFTGSKYERKLLNYFQNNAKNLKDMKLDSISLIPRNV